MAKLIMMSGLPASGKSTLAKEMLKTMGNGVRLNKDLIRTMLHFDKFTGTNEGITQDAEKELARYFLKKHTNVIIDDTNLSERHLTSWKEIARQCEAKFEHKPVETSFIDCLQRDGLREKSVGRTVIMNMALQYGMVPKPEKGFVLCDLDGTLCDIKHRLHFVKAPLIGAAEVYFADKINKLETIPSFKKDWKSFFAEIPNDKLNIKVDLMLQEFRSNGHEIIFLSARPDNYRKETEEWLSKNITYPYLTLIMRRGGDSRPDYEVKKELLETYFKDKSFIHTIIDDRPSVLRVWKQELGEERVIDVGNGIEF